MSSNRSCLTGIWVEWPKLILLASKLSMIPFSLLPSPTSSSGPQIWSSTSQVLPWTRFSISTGVCWPFSSGRMQRKRTSCRSSHLRSLRWKMPSWRFEISCGSSSLDGQGMETLPKLSSDSIERMLPRALQKCIRTISIIRSTTGSLLVTRCPRRNRWIDGSAQDEASRGHCVGQHKQKSADAPTLFLESYTPLCTLVSFSSRSMTIRSASSLSQDVT